MPVHVITDSVSSIPRELAEHNGIEVVTLFVNDGDRQLADLEIDTEDFYRRLADMAHLPTSSQPSVEALVSSFGRAVRDGLDVVGVFISEKMSGTVETARMAADMVLQEHPGGSIEVIDSRSNSLQEGFVALAAARAAQAGESLEQCVKAALETIPRTRYLFTPQTLEYLRRGGRIGSASALLGSLLQVRPILTVSDGETTTFEKVRTQGKALAAMTRQFTEDIRRFGLKQVFVHYISDRAAAETYAREQIEPIVGEHVEVIPVSPVIGLHVGPAVAVVYETERDIA